MRCQCGENELQENEKICWWCFQEFRDRLKEFKPSLTKDKKLEELIPGQILNAMPII